MQTDYTTPKFRDQLSLTYSDGSRVAYNLGAKGLLTILSAAEDIVDRQDKKRDDLIEALSDEFYTVPKTFLRQLVNMITGDDEKYYLIREDRLGYLSNY